MTKCGICLVNFDSEFISCNNNHKFDEECISHYFDTLNSESTLNYWRKHNKIKCVLCDGFFEEDEFFNKSICKKYIKTTRQIIIDISSIDTEKRIINEMIKENQTKTTSVSNQIIKEIKDILTNCISCPYCNKAFIDFTGCLALECANCNKEFCGICLKIHENSDSHKNVLSHTQNFIKEDINIYGVDNYYMSTSGWELWSDKIKVDAIVQYLSNIRLNILWQATPDIIQVITKENLLKKENIIKLEHIIYSHDNYGVHLVRLPVIYWNIYSIKYDIKIENIFRDIEIPSEDRISIGIYVLKAVKKEYPNFKQIKHYIPGESFAAINYPPELLYLITKAIEDWGKINERWK